MTETFITIIMSSHVHGSFDLLTTIFPVNTMLIVPFISLGILFDLFILFVTEKITLFVGVTILGRRNMPTIFLFLSFIHHSLCE